MNELAVEQLALRLPTADCRLLDVREAWEFALCHIPGSLHVPLGELPARAAGLPRDQPLVVICHHGVRSRAAQQYLLEQGWSAVFNLTGGIDAWAREVDPAMVTY
ncbi:MAG: sulfurtransferase [Gammaproteobacteria bacterium]|nr:sulfurtransferase [Gammaproteobacteria bacterium]